MSDVTSLYRPLLVRPISKLYTLHSCILEHQNPSLLFRTATARRSCADGTPEYASEIHERCARLCAVSQSQTPTHRSHYHGTAVRSTPQVCMYGPNKVNTLHDLWLC